MYQGDLARKINCAMHVIYKAFAKLVDCGSGDDDLRICAALRWQVPRQKQSLRWTLPFLWCGLVYLSFALGCNSCKFFLGGRDANPLLFSCSSPILLCSADDHSPYHGDDPNGKDPHDEIHDPGLPANQDPPGIFDAGGESRSNDKGGKPKNILGAGI